MSRTILFSLLSAACLLCFGCGGDSGSSTVFELRIANVAPDPTTFTTQSGQPLVVVFSSGAGAVHLLPAPIYAVGQPAGDAGLETLAEDGNPQDLAESLQLVEGVTLAFIAATPIEENAASGILGPGQTYRVIINVEDLDARLSFALAYLQANDVFVATQQDGVPLFDAAGNPRSGDITSEFAFYDAGTEVNQAPGDGPDQAPRQMEENQGAAEGGAVQPLNDGFSYPAVADVLRIEIVPIGEID